MILEQNLQWMASTILCPRHSQHYRELLSIAH